jgi:hypothetical protein
MARRFHRARHHLGAATKGLKGSAFSLVTGAASSTAVSYAATAIPFLASNWWAMPSAIALVGHFLKRRNPAIGDALLGVAGGLLYSQYMATHGTGAKGFIDAGAMLPGSSDAGAFLGSSSYNDNVGTSASPRLGTAEAAMLYTPHPWSPPAATANAGEFIDAGGDAMGIES